MQNGLVIAELRTLITDVITELWAVTHRAADDPAV